MKYLILNFFFTFAKMFHEKKYNSHYFAVTKPQNENDIWQVDYGKLTPILVQSI